ncbi:MAG: flagellar transcriptional regulator FlhD [Thiobacillaceae bacterium]|jgi:flagellar transcriptional activator FlhD
MNSDELMAEIREINLSYLMLAQQMIRQDKTMAAFRLGIGQDVADLVGSLSPAQVLKLARSGMLLSRLRFDDDTVLDMLANYTKDRSLAQSHAAILMAGQELAALA